MSVEFRKKAWPSNVNFPIFEIRLLSEWMKLWCLRILVQVKHESAKAGNAADLGCKDCALLTYHGECRSSFYFSATCRCHPLCCKVPSLTWPCGVQD